MKRRNLFRLLAAATVVPKLPAPGAGSFVNVVAQGPVTVTLPKAQVGCKMTLFRSALVEQAGIIRQMVEEHELSRTFVMTEKGWRVLEVAPREPVQVGVS